MRKKPSSFKRSIQIAGHRTSVGLEPPFWAEVDRILQERKLSLNALVTEIDAERSGSLASALRLWVLNDLKRR